MIRLSIITINYNNLSGLKKTVESVLSQSYSNFEYIVIDGNSTDGSKEYIQSLDGKFAYWISENDTGVYNAMNKGILKAKGEYCLFLNSGDYLVNQEILKKVFAVNYAEDIVYGDMLLEEGNNKRILSTQPSTLTFEHFLSSSLWHPVSFIKTVLFEKYGFYNEAFKIVSDYEFFLKTIIIHNVSYRHVPITISVYKVEGISSFKENEPLNLAERKKVLETHFPLSVIETAQRLEALNGSRVIKVYRIFQKYPGLLKQISKIASILKK